MMQVSTILVLIKLICDHVPAMATFGNLLSGRAIEPIPDEPVNGDLSQTKQV
jgi:hypothetical protein